MLQITIDGKKTSSRDTVADSKLYCTVASRNSTEQLNRVSYFYFTHKDVETRK